MPYDGAGLFTRSYNFTADKLAAIKIQSARMDGEFDNYAAGMNQVLLRNGVVPMSGNLKMGTNSVTGIASGAAATPSLQFAADVTSGFYLASAGVIGFAAGGVSILTVSAAGIALAASLAVTDNVEVDGLTMIHGAFEASPVLAVAATGTLQLDYLTGAIAILDLNAVANFTFNIRGDASNSLNSIMDVDQCLTLAVEVPQGVTPYHCTAITVDGGVPSQLKWFGGAPSSGNASGVDVYTITVIKKAANTFYVRASMLQAL